MHDDDDDDDDKKRDMQFQVNLEAGMELKPEFYNLVLKVHYFYNLIVFTNK